MASASTPIRQVDPSEEDEALFALSIEQEVELHRRAQRAQEPALRSQMREAVYFDEHGNERFAYLQPEYQAFVRGVTAP